MQGEKPVFSQEKENTTKTQRGLGFALSLLHAENNRFLQSTGNSLLPPLFSSPDCVINGRYDINRNTETAG